MSLTGSKVVQIRLITKQDQYALQDVAYTVDIYSTSGDLNKLVNTLLQKSHIKPVDFDFLVADQFLENTLFDHLQNRNISVENDVAVEYVEKYPAPEPQECLLHDDWVSAVKINKKWILSGCYDNTINLWTASGSHVLTISGHSMPIKALTWVSLDDKKGQFLSASQDQTVFLWEWNILENSVHPLYEYKGHQRGIDCVEINSDFTKFATGSWDTVLKVWSAETKEDTDDSSIKYSSKYGSTRTPLLTLQGHKENISAVHWIDAETILSSSWDQTLKIWNLNIEGIQSEVTANKSFFDVSYSPLNRLIITASADKNLRLYDTRSNHNSVVASTFIGHTQWVQSVEWSKAEEHLFISGAYDNKIKLWDCRSPKAPLYDLFAHSDKVLDVDWSNPKYVVSGGADNTVRIFKSK